MCSYTETFLVCMYVNILNCSHKNKLILYIKNILHILILILSNQKISSSMVLLGNTNSAYGVVLHILHLVQKSHEQQKSVDIFIELL